MKQILVAGIFATALCASASAKNEGRVELHYRCGEASVYERVDEALLNGHDDLFHERLSAAVAEGSCEIVDADQAAVKAEPKVKPKISRAVSVSKNKGSLARSSQSQKRKSVGGAQRSKDSLTDKTSGGRFPSRDTFEPVR